MLAKRYGYDGKETIKLNAIQLAAKRRVEQKVDEGFYGFETSECIICGNNDFETLAEKDRYGLRMPVVICSSCGLIQTNPHMTQEAYNDFYNTDYRKLYGGEDTATSDFFADQRVKGKRILDFLQAHNIFEPGPSKLVLEVGCGAGGILSRFQEAGCRIIGIDIGEEYIEFGRKYHHLDLYVGTVEDLNLDRSPDIIIYADVLEHILTPLNELRNLSKLMSKDSRLYIGLPGVKSLMWDNLFYQMDFLRYLQNAHIWHFSQRTLQNLLGQAQFCPVVSTETIKGVFKLTDAQNYTWQSDFHDAMRYLKRLELMRSILPFSTYKLAAIRKLGIVGSVRKINEKARDFFTTDPD